MNENLEKKPDGDVRKKSKTCRVCGREHDGRWRDCYRCVGRMVRKRYRCAVCGGRVSVQGGICRICHSDGVKMVRDLSCGVCVLMEGG